MRLLLDTHILLWWLTDDVQLGGLGDEIEDAATDAVVSAASVWEIEIKRAIGKLEAPEDLLDQIQASGFGLLSMSPEHAVAAGRLPRHHHDPFDRMLIAQAQIEGRKVATHDRRFADYDVPTYR